MDRLLKDVVLVSISAVRCDEYLVYFVQSNKKILFNAENGPPSVKIVFHKYRVVE
jgi:hypothetical protein